MIEWLLPEILQTSLQHVAMVLIAVAIATVVAVPAAIALTRRPAHRRWAMSVVNVLQTVPSLALFGFLIPIPLIGGIGRRTAIVALVLYALLPVVRNTLTGILSVDRGVRESAVAMGMTDRELLWSVELPLAFPSILAGLRIATVTTVGTATIAAAIGGGGLGTFIFRGLAMVNTATILAGAIPAALMAIVADEGLGWFERRYSLHS
jgi:osmoprotectant transport system permease protein